MILAGTLLAAASAILFSEILGRGRVIYTRLATLAAAYAASCAIAAYVAISNGAGLGDGLAIALSVVPMMAAWMGLRIHLSNSVTLEMVTLLEEAGPLSAAAMVRAYDPGGHTARRLQVLRDAEYLAGADDRVAPTAKGRAVLLLIRLLCGRNGPRAVVAMLERRRGGR